MKKIDAWLLTEGAHGMISQVEGLAKSLNVNYQHRGRSWNDKSSRGISKIFKCKLST